MVVLAVVLTLLTMLSGVGTSALASTIGFVYPAWKSFEAIETKRKDDDTQWLIYWVVYSFFSIIELFSDFLLYWIPFYYSFKLAFLIWLMLPQTNGAITIYNHFLKDFLKSNEAQMDEMINRAKRGVSGVGEGLADAAKTGVAAAEKAMGGKVE